MSPSPPLPVMYFPISIPDRCTHWDRANVTELIAVRFKYLVFEFTCFRALLMDESDRSQLRRQSLMMDVLQNLEYLHSGTTRPPFSTDHGAPTLRHRGPGWVRRGTKEESRHCVPRWTGTPSTRPRCAGDSRRGFGGFTSRTRRTFFDTSGT